MVVFSRLKKGVRESRQIRGQCPLLYIPPQCFANIKATVSKSRDGKAANHGMSQKTCHFFEIIRRAFGNKSRIKMKRAPLLSLLLSISFPLVAQKDSVWTKDLKEVAVEAQRSQVFSVSHKVELADSFLKVQFNSSMLSSLLDATSGLVIRNYGPGILATSSFRGGNAQQTAITWNGLSLNSPVNGLCDFNLIPSFFFNTVEVLPGLTNTLQGSGALSGGINLANSISSKSGLTIEALQSAGSFGTFNTGLSAQWHKNKWQHSSKVFGSIAQNNYPFINYSENGAPWQILKNAEIKTLSALHETSFRHLKIGTVKLSYWGSFAQRQIPPTMLMSSSDALQIDHIHRLKFQWDKSIKKVIFKFHSFLQKDYLKYNESAIDINSISKSFIFTNDFESRFKLVKNGKSGFGATHTYAEAHIANILPNETITLNNSTRNLVAFWFSHIQKIPKLKTTLSASVRKEIINAKALPYIPALGFKTKLSENFEIYGQSAYVFRFPTLNDLYWIPGGNDSLKPEKGWAHELSAEFHQNKNKLFYSVSITGFMRNITNWIQWQPVSSQVWSPVNIGRVKSSGLEFRSNLGINFTKKTRGRIGFSFDYTQSQNLETKQANFKKQLIYIPFIKSTGFATLIYGTTGFTIQGIVVGKRYTSSDNMDSLPLYGVLNFTLSKTIPFKKHSANVYGKLNNLLNKSYQAIIWRPMPGINFEFGISLSLIGH